MRSRPEAYHKMKMRLAAAAVSLLLAGTPAAAHILDEYLQATTISVEKARLQAEIRLTPGVALFPKIIATIDTDANGVISEAEQHAYAARVLGDLSLAVDGNYLPLRLAALNFPGIEEMKEGHGEIQLELIADVPPGRATHRTLTFENHHQRQMAAYLVNCLVPRDPDIQIKAQNRNHDQSFYQLDYVQAGLGPGPQSSAEWRRSWIWLGAAALLLVAGAVFLWRCLAGTCRQK